MKKARIKAKGVFFDLFGTLLLYGDMKRAWLDWVSRFHSLLRLNGLTMPREDFTDYCTGFFSRQAPRRNNNHLTVYELRIRKLCDDLNLTVKTDDIKRIAIDTVAIWQKQILLAPNATSVLKGVKQSKIVGLITNFDHPPHIYNLIEEYELAPLFDVVVISGEVELKKPDPGIFRIALDKTDLEPHQTVYVGDTEEDVKGAKAASMIPVRIQRRIQVKNGYAYDFDLKETKNTTDENCEPSKSPGVQTINSLVQLRDLLT